VCCVRSAVAAFLCGLNFADRWSLEVGGWSAGLSDRRQLKFLRLLLTVVRPSFSRSLLSLVGRSVGRSVCPGTHI
jgi:hypothetical protein